MPEATDEAYLGQVRLMLEELCCDLCRFEHVSRDGSRPESVQIDREVDLGKPSAFADVRVTPETGPGYFVEVKYGYPDEVMTKHLRHKYGPDTPGSAQAGKLVLVADVAGRANWPQTLANVQQAIRPGMQLELWDEEQLFAKLRDRFGVEVNAITAANLLDVRQAIDRAKGFHAFGGPSLAAYDHDPLKAELLWHFGFWRLRQLREARQLTPREIMPPGTYRDVAVLLADMCSFSSYVRDTSEAEIIRESLTTFYSRARYQIINQGGMLSQFIGDEVVGFFGLPEADPSEAQSAFASAQALLSIGRSVSHQWQRRIDRQQASSGLHIGMAIGDLEVVSLRPFSRTHVGAIGDCINVAARLMTAAGPSEVVVSNSFHRKLPDSAKALFTEEEAIEAKNVGRIKAWRCRP